MRARIYERQGRVGEALAEADAAVALEPNSSAALLARAGINERQGRLREALADLAAALAVVGTSDRITAERDRVRALLAAAAPP
jgi:tetratricopeptide (TPR) repeat protein